MKAGSPTHQYLNQLKAKMGGAIEVILPGGLIQQGSLRCDAVLEPITGLLEQSLHGVMRDFDNTPAQVSAIIGQALRTLGGQTADSNMAAAMCVADRQYLMLRLSQMIDGDQLWLHSDCDQCGARFDVSLLRSALPIQPAGSGFPIVETNIQNYKLRLRIPTGEDQERIAKLEDDEALRNVLENCIVDIEPTLNRREFIAGLSNTDIEKIDAALDLVSPSLSTTILCQCPDCRANQTVPLDPYSLFEISTEGLYKEVHTLAYYYHWSEGDILSLPKSRRRRYLRLIDLAQGKYH